MYHIFFLILWALLCPDQVHNGGHGNTNVPQTMSTNDTGGETGDPPPIPPPPPPGSGG